MTTIVKSEIELHYNTPDCVSNSLNERTSPNCGLCGGGVTYTTHKFGLSGCISCGV